MNHLFYHLMNGCITDKNNKYQMSYIKLYENWLEDDKYNFLSLEDKIAHIKAGNIITFKNPLPGRNNGQIGIREIKRNKSGAIKLLGYFFDTPWYQSERELIDAIDWEWMRNNVMD